MSSFGDNIPGTLVAQFLKLWRYYCSESKPILDPNQGSICGGGSSGGGSSGEGIDWRGGGGGKVEKFYC